MITTVLVATFDAKVQWNGIVEIVPDRREQDY